MLLALLLALLLELLLALLTLLLALHERCCYRRRCYRRRCYWCLGWFCYCPTTFPTPEAASQKPPSLAQIRGRLRRPETASGASLTA
jgi:hypothetical protein